MSSKNDVSGWGIDDHLDYTKIYITFLLEWPKSENTECIWYILNTKSNLLQYSCLENPMDGGAW